MALGEKVKLAGERRTTRVRGDLILGGNKVTLNQDVEEASHVDPGAPGANGKCKGPAAGAPLPTPGNAQAGWGTAAVVRGARRAAPPGREDLAPVTGT